MYLFCATKNINTRILTTMFQFISKWKCKRFSFWPGMAVHASNPSTWGKWQEITTNWRPAGLHRVPGHPGTQLNSVSINKEVPKSVCTFIICFSIPKHLCTHSQMQGSDVFQSLPFKPQWRDGNHAAPTSQTLPVLWTGNVSSLVRLSYRTPLPFCLD